MRSVPPRQDARIQQHTLVSTYSMYSAGVFQQAVCSIDCPFRVSRCASMSLRRSGGMKPQEKPQLPPMR